MIKNIVFDMGNVLIQYDPRRYAEAVADNKADQDLFLQEVFHSVEWVRQDRGDLTEEEIIASICTRLPARLHAGVGDLFTNWHRDIPPFPEMEALIAGLKEQGYGIYLLSNTGRRYHKFRENIPALRYFDGEFASCDWGLLKPDPAIYRTFCAHFGLVPASCFFIDDNAANIEGALRTGMKGAVYHGDLERLRKAMTAAGIRI